MGTYRIVPTALTANEWTTVAGTPLTAVIGQVGTSSNVIKTPLAAGNYRLRGSFSGSSFSLNGGAAQTFASLPAGFTPTSATVRIVYSKNGDNSAHVFPQFDEFTEGSSDDSAFAYPSTTPSALLLYLRGAGMRGAGSAASSVLLTDGIFGTPALYIDGTYTIVSSTWYYNPTTDHFEYVLDSDPVPSAPWVVADPSDPTPGDPTPGDPTPAVSSVKRYSVYTDGTPDATSLIAPAVGCVGTLIFIAGSGFGDGAQVTVGGILADNITVIDQTLITCEVPTGVSGSADIVVYNPDGAADTVVAGFTGETPWWTKCISYDIDGITRSYSVFVVQCVAPIDGDTWTITTDPETGGTGSCGDAGAGYLVSYGWFISPSAFTGDVITVATNPDPPRQWDQLSWTTGDAAMLGGFPGIACMHRNRLIYPAKGYTQGTDYPPIRTFDGLFDHQVTTLPPTITDTVPKAVIAMLAANNTIYFSAHESGTTSADFRGRVFSLDLDSGVVVPLGGQFAAGELPYALAWHMGRLWCGTNKTDSTAGSVYYFRPDVDTAWTTDYTLTTSSVGGCTSLCSYNGELYVGTDNAAGSRGKVLVRDSAGAYTTSDTGSGGTAVVNNGYHSLAVFNGNLYAGYWNNDTTAITEIRKFDGSSWSTVYSGAGSTLRPIVILLADNGVLFALGAMAGALGMLLSSPDGTTWTDQTEHIPGTGREFQPALATVVM